MKMMKKTLSLLLAAAIAMSIGGTFVFAETTTALTGFPTAPAEDDDYYVIMQNDISVYSGTFYYVAANSETSELEMKTGTGHWKNHPKNYTRGLYIDANAMTPIHGKDLTIGSISGKKYFSIKGTGNITSVSPTIDNNRRRTGNNIALQTLNTDEKTYTTITEGKLMLHTDEVIIEKPDSGVYTGFGLGTQKELLTYNDSHIQAWAYVGMSGEDDNLTLRVQDSSADGSADILLDLSDYAKPDVAFDMKVLIDLDNKTYDVYINDRPAATSLKFENSTVASIVMCLRGTNEDSSNFTEPTMAFGTTKCYPMSDPDAAQYKKAAMEKAFDRTFSADSEAVLFYTFGGETPSADYVKYFGDNGAFRSFKCDGVTGFKVDKAQVGESSYYKVYYTGTGMNAYSYDNLEYVYVGKPEATNEKGKVTGTYELIGGKGAAFKPIVITALYEDNTRATLVEAKCTESTGTMYGTYGGEEFLPDNNLDNPAASAFIWGGKSLLVPLFGRVDFN